MVSSSMLWTVSVLLFSSLTSALPSLSKRATVSPDGTCGGTKGYTCQGSNFGNSCGKYNLCGRDTSYSELSQGCQPAYGFCYAKGSVSPDGTCGGSDMFICLGSNFGNSCGPNNRCGSDAGYSGTGCQPAYGYCQRCTTTVSPSTTTTTLSTTTTVPATATTSTTVTVTSGIATTSTTVTTTSSTTSTGTVTITVTTTPATVTATSSVTTTTTVSSGTVTVTTTNPLVLQKRAAATDAVPMLPLRIDTTAAARLAIRATGPGLSCGTVISTGFTTTTISTTQTLTATTTTTTTIRSSTTVPSTTTTISSTSTVITTLSATTTISVTTAAATPSTTVTATSTLTSTVPAATTTVGVSGGVYSKSYERTDTNTCFYDYSKGYLDRIGVSSDPSNNYAVPVSQCAGACTANTACKSFVLSHSTDPSGTYQNYCFLIDHAYTSSDISCVAYATTTTYIVDYTKTG